MTSSIMFRPSTTNLILHQFGSLLKDAQLRAQILQDLPRNAEQIALYEKRHPDTSRLWLKDVGTRANSAFDFTMVDEFPLDVKIALSELVADINVPDLPVELYNDRTLSFLMLYLPKLATRLQTEADRVTLDFFLAPERAYTFNVNDYVTVELTRRALSQIKATYLPLLRNASATRDENEKNVERLKVLAEGLEKKINHQNSLIRELKTSLNDASLQLRNRTLYAENVEYLSKLNAELNNIKSEIAETAKRVKAFDMLRQKIFNDYAEYETRILQRLILLFSARTRERRNRPRGELVASEVRRIEERENAKIQPRGYAQDASRNFTRERTAALSTFTV